MDVKAAVGFVDVGFVCGPVLQKKAFLHCPMVKKMGLMHEQQRTMQILKSIHEENWTSEIYFKFYKWLDFVFQLPISNIRIVVRICNYYVWKLSFHSWLDYKSNTLTLQWGMGNCGKTLNHSVWVLCIHMYCASQKQMSQHINLKMWEETKQMQ